MNAKQMDISTHISTLLKFNECVVIPDFGSFISNYVPSQFDPGRNAYLPPSKEVVFNSKITKNDGLLINHLVESETITYTQAYQAVSNWVSNAFETLNEGEKLDLNGLGSLELDHNGSFVFVTDTSFFLAESYGLDAVSFPKIIRPVYINSYNQRPAVKAISKHKYFISIAAGITLVLSLSLFPLKIKKENLNVSNLNPLTAITSTTPNPVVETTIEEPVKAKEEEIVAENNFFILVGGSFEKLENAKSYYTELLDEGNHAEIIEMKNGRFRVVVDSYKTKEEALTAMENYRANHIGSQVWVSTR